jgi:hypothetical protein
VLKRNAFFQVVYLQDDVVNQGHFASLLLPGVRGKGLVAGDLSIIAVAAAVTGFHRQKDADY